MVYFEEAAGLSEVFKREAQTRKLSVKKSCYWSANAADIKKVRKNVVTPIDRYFRNMGTSIAVFKTVVFTSGL